MAYQQPTKGKQSVQEYHPERGTDFTYQVSTYNGDSWLISFCSPAKLSRTKTLDMSRATMCDCCKSLEK